MPVATTEMRILPDRRSSKVEPKMMLASGSTSSRMRFAASSTSNNVMSRPPVILFEVDEAANRIREEVDPDANIIFGSTFDETLSGKMRISVVATGIDAEALAQARPAISLVSNRETVPGLREATSGGYTQPVLTQNAAQPPL